ncbi:MAG: DEAD/DEAH box helicase, partial [Pseudomonadota bacterium]
MTETAVLIPETLTARRSSAGWGRLIGASAALAAVEYARAASGPVLLLADDPRQADRLEAECRFFAGEDFDVLHFVEWETLPWDNFSPHQDIISERLKVLAALPDFSRGIVIASAPALLQRLPPTGYVAARTMSLAIGQTLPRAEFVDSLVAAGYYRVPQVTEHGEFAVRGSLIDIFPMGTQAPIRVDYFDDEIESLRTFSPDTQLSGDTLNSVALLPAREIPLDESDVREFRARYRERFEGQPGKSRVYRDVSDGIAHGGVEYYLPLFFDETAALTSYLPDNCVVIAPDGLAATLDTAWSEIRERYELHRHDVERPILSPEETFFSIDDVSSALGKHPQTLYSAQSLAERKGYTNLPTRLPPALKIEARYEDPAAGLMQFLNGFDGRILFTAESAGRREQLFELLSGRGLDIARFERWDEFLAAETHIGLVIAPLESGVLLPESKLALLSEQQLFGDRVRQKRRRRAADRDPETIIRQLNDLQPGSPVVHAEYGVGRYLGLATLAAGGIKAEFLHIEYADGDKLYVPVHALDLISRYTGASPETAPLHRLGSDQWAKARKRAAQRARDVAAELLDTYARRAARPGHAFNWPESDYRAFEAGFPFELTEDQATTIDAVLADLASDQPMDRVVCGDVGFGKTEVALRATFAAVHGGKQVAILVPTTLLAQQHGENFRDRFADWPVRVEILSRFQSPKQVKEILAGLRSGSVDVVIGTHRLLQHTRDMKDVGLVIIDEEHRFGVRHKEAIKSLRSEIDVLTLTATPIPRTLNLALGGLRDLSLITTPPAERLAVKTFVSEWNDTLIREACLREIKRGGQVYFIHNRVED